MHQFGNFNFDAAAESRLLIPTPQAPRTLFERPTWQILHQISHYPGQDIDEYRAKHGKVNGELEFFDRFQPERTSQLHGNLLMYGGASLMIECLIGNGTATSAQALTYLNSSQGYIGVGDSTTAEAYGQTDLQASTNKVRQIFDSGYPLHTDGTSGKTISAATNASPISITATGHGFSTGDIVHISGVAGNTAANNVWQITVVDANTFTLNGSTGNASYTSGGLASKFNVAVFQATFGTGVGNFTWNEWAMFNASSSGKMFNRKVASLGTKTSSGSMALKTAFAIG